MIGINFHFGAFLRVGNGLREAHFGDRDGLAETGGSLSRYSSLAIVVSRVEVAGGAGEVGGLLSRGKEGW
jgi:hypothetical protein